ncbi:hypothetical protein SSX86_019934 [Deinandra increscens subsp. villosa]|uniref:RRM domain-containing protein n=1 Tax=Deinandra increscens subsp. villosa TaxID=3103831 RepID=A0AAP0GXQ5_9ASTR
MGSSMLTGFFMNFIRQNNVGRMTFVSSMRAKTTRGLEVMAIHGSNNRKDKYKNSGPRVSSVAENKFAPSKWENVDSWSTTVYVTNLPPLITKKGIMDRCAKVGSVVDAFIPEKSSSLGKRYAFVRFVKGSDMSLGSKEDQNQAGVVFLRVPILKPFTWEFLSKILQSTRYGKKVPGPFEGVHGHGSNEPVSNGVNVNILDKTAGKFNGSPGVTCRGAKDAGSKSCSSDAVEVKKSVKEIGDIPVELLGSGDGFSNSLCIKVNNIHSLCNLHHLVSNEGFKNVSFRYLGGLWVRVDCSSKEECIKFSKCEGLKLVFHSCFKPSGGMVIKERVIWLEIRGLPLCAWNNAVFHHIAKQWGENLFGEEDIEEPLSCGRVCILTDRMDRIQEVASVNVNGLSYLVEVVEIQSWSPSFGKNGDDSSESEEEGDADGFSNSDNDNFSINNDLDVGCNQSALHKDEGFAHSVHEVETNRSSNPQENDCDDGMGDPRNIKEFLNNFEVGKSVSLSLSVPPGFSHINKDMAEELKVDYKAEEESVKGGLGVPSNHLVGNVSLTKSGEPVGVEIKSKANVRVVQNISILEELNRYIKWGLALGLDMDDTHPGEYLIFGDFNVSRTSSERMGADFNEREAKDFNDFINGCDLEDVKLGGFKFTRVVKEVWEDSMFSSRANSFIRFKEKLKVVKAKLKEWNKERMFKEKCERDNLLERLEGIEVEMEAGGNLSTLHEEKISIVRDLKVIDKHNAFEMSQKIKSKWTMEGDENSKFFHAYLKKRRRLASIRGIKDNGVWVEDPGVLKNLFFEGGGVWNDIRYCAKGLHVSGEVPSNSFCRVTGNGENTNFWEDIWIGNECLAQKFPRLFALENNKECKVADRLVGNIRIWSWRRDIRGGVEELQFSAIKDLLASTSVTNASDGWAWNLDGNNSFEVKHVRKVIEKSSLPEVPLKTRWNKNIPKKINIFIWRLLRDRLATRCKLIEKGIPLANLGCVFCNEPMESGAHLFSNCSLIKNIWFKLKTWLSLDFDTSGSPFEVLAHLDSSMYSKKRKRLLDGIFCCVWWNIWKLRNDIIYNGNDLNKFDIFENIVRSSFLFLSSRDKHYVMSSSNWLDNPLIKEKDSRWVKDDDELVKRSVDWWRNCNMHSGKWVRHEGYPIYKPGSSPIVDEAFDCQAN